MLVKEAIQGRRNAREWETPQDVAWVGWEDWGYFTWDEFVKFAEGAISGDFTYEPDKDRSFEPLSANRLLIVGKGENWWLERKEYDGCKWWKYKTFSQKPLRHEDLNCVKSKSVDFSR